MFQKWGRNVGKPRRAKDKVLALIGVLPGLAGGEGATIVI
jgi:hypothetical protein